jgi:hypothetical protein
VVTLVTGIVTVALSVSVVDTVSVNVVDSVKVVVSVTVDVTGGKVVVIVTVVQGGGQAETGLIFAIHNVVTRMITIKLNILFI